MTTIVCEGRASEGNGGCGALLAEEDDLCERERIGMRDRELRRSSADLREASCGASVQLQLRRPSRLADYFDVTPQDALRVSCSKRLHRRFLGRKASREMNRGIPATHAVRDFAVSEDPAGKALPISFDRRGDSGNVGGVES